jgi:hypothetical protein
MTPKKKRQRICQYGPENEIQQAVYHAQKVNDFATLGTCGQHFLELLIKRRREGTNLLINISLAHGAMWAVAVCLA